MKREHFLLSIFFLIAGAFFYLFYRLVIPFFAPICWAAVLVIIFHPLYKRVAGKVRSPGLASLLLCLFIIILIIGPIAYLFSALVQEAADAVAKVNAMYRAGEFDNILSFNVPFLDAVRDKLSQYYDLSKVNLNQLIKDSIDKVGGVIIGQTTWLIANGTKTLFYFAIMLFTMYYFFKDGELIIRRLKRLMPLSQDRIDKTFKQLHDVIQATMYGGVVVALIQGLLGGILFAVFGIPSAVFWGAIMALLSIIPFLGAFIIYIPAGIILIIGGAYIKGLVVIIIGTVIISQIDNVLRPYFISGRTCLHPLMLFFAIMGGISVFGLLGVVLGPLVAAVFITVLDVLDYRLHVVDNEEDMAEMEQETKTQGE